MKLKSETEFLDDELHAHRAGTYELLGRLLSRSPDSALLEQLRRLDPVDTSAGSLAMAWEMLRLASLEADVSDLETEYFALFIGVGRGELVPFGSWYLTGFLMEKPVAQLRGDLARLGIERQAGVVESEDHVAALCDAMALLIRDRDDEAWARQQAFHGAHLAPWIERFFTDLQDTAHSRFYRSAGFLGQVFFEFEQRLLTMQA